MYKINLQNAKDVLNKNITIENMTIKKLTVICKQHERKEDGKMPNKKDILIQKYKEWSARPDPTFDVDDIDFTSTINIDDKIGIIHNNEDGDAVPVAL